MPYSRRHVISTLILAPAAAAVHRPRVETQGTAAPHTLPPLPYPNAALEPHIDARTMEIHHGRHHRAYVDNLNAALGRAKLTTPLEELLANLSRVPESERAAIRNNGGGHYNHSLFWTVMSPRGGGAPGGAIAEALKSTFGSLETFTERFGQAATGHFGSGWAWLSDDKGKLVIHTTPNQDTPLAEGRRPILGLDVWEHAYYLQYQNQRARYVAAFWNIVDWNEVNRRLKG